MDKIEQTLNIIFASERPMPAHFTSNGDRTQSFCINFDQLTKEDDEAMASLSWGSAKDFLADNSLIKGDHLLIQRGGEESVIAAYVLTKLGGENELDKLQQSVVEELIQMLGPLHPDIKSLFAKECAIKYFDYCQNYGHELALERK